MGGSHLAKGNSSYWNSFGYVQHGCFPNGKFARNPEMLHECRIQAYTIGYEPVNPFIGDCLNHPLRGGRVTRLNISSQDFPVSGEKRRFIVVVFNGGISFVMRMMASLEKRRFDVVFFSGFSANSSPFCSPIFPSAFIFSGTFSRLSFRLCFFPQRFPVLIFIFR